MAGVVGLELRNACTTPPGRTAAVLRRVGEAERRGEAIATARIGWSKSVSAHAKNATHVSDLHDGVGDCLSRARHPGLGWVFRLLLASAFDCADDRGMRAVCHCALQRRQCQPWRAGGSLEPPGAACLRFARAGECVAAGLHGPPRALDHRRRWDALDWRCTAFGCSTARHGGSE
jgi:hypothetical protein